MGLQLAIPLPLVRTLLMLCVAAASCNCAAAVTAHAAGHATAAPAAWHNASLSSAQRTQSLLSELSLEEKVSLLQVNQPRIERVGLPAYNFGRECERGDTSGKLGTAYPTGLALAGAFDVELVHAIALATALEVQCAATLALAPHFARARLQSCRPRALLPVAVQAG